MNSSAISLDQQSYAATNALQWLLSSPVNVIHTRLTSSAAHISVLLAAITKENPLEPFLKVNLNLEIQMRELYYYVQMLGLHSPSIIQHWSNLIPRLVLFYYFFPYFPSN
jgi:hypothetical protein